MSRDSRWFTRSNAVGRRLPSRRLRAEHLEDRRLLAAAQLNELFHGPIYEGAPAWVKRFAESDHDHDHFGSLDVDSIRERTRTHIIGGEAHEFTWEPAYTESVLDSTAAAASAVGAATFALSSIPVLNSLLGATASIYLDFNGHFEATWGGFNNADTPVYDVDGDRTTFNDMELANIRSVWERAAEDFMPFNINVTTVEPPALAPGAPASGANGVALRIAIGGSSMDWYGSNVGGVAYIDSFTSSISNVAYVFAGGTNSVRWIGDTVSHEAGHAFGLQHQSKYNSAGEKILEYNSGDSVWTPLMGLQATTDAQISTWHNGTSTLGPTSFQDDIAHISRPVNVFGFRADDRSNSTAGATPLAAAGANWSGTGFVGANGDIDWFSIDLAAPTNLKIAVNGLEVVRNLDVAIELRDADGTMFATSDPSGSYNASLTRNLVGRNYIGVKSSGAYGRLGQYTVTVTESLPGVSVSHTALPFTTSESGRSEAVTLVLTSKPTSDVRFDVVSSDPTEGAPSSGDVVFTPENWYTPQTVTITGVNDTVLDGDSEYTVTVSAAISEDPIYNGNFDPDDLTLVNVDDDGAGRLYWLNTVNKTIHRSSLAGHNADTLLDSIATFGAGSSFLSRISLDPIGGKMYWTDRFAGRIHRANLDGSSPESLVTGLPGVAGIAIDSQEGKIYWADLTTHKIQRSNLNGTGIEDLIVTGINVPGTIELDTAAGKMYWTDGFTVCRANLNGSGIETLVPSDGVTTYGGLELDIAAGKMYFSGGTHPAFRLYRANLDGTDSTVVVDTGAWAFPAAIGEIAIDHASGHVYWADNPISNRIYRAGLDGSNVAVVEEGGDGYTGVAILPGTPGFTTTPASGLSTTEAGGTATFTVELNYPPTADVSIPLSTSDLSEGVVAPLNLTFTPANWNVRQTVSVTGVNDGFGDGNINYQAVLGPAVSSDSAYDGLNPADVTISNLDNEIVTATFTKTENATIPDRGTFTSNLPITAGGSILDLDVRVNITHGWNEDLDVTLIAPDGTRIELFTDVGGATSNFTNTILDDEASAAITAGAAPFTGRFRPEGNLTSLEGKNLTGTWRLEARDDARFIDGRLVDWSITARALSGSLGPGFVVTPVAGLVTSEAGGTASFSVRLDSSPSANVTVSVSSSDTTEGTPSTTSLTFTSANWSTPQTVTITGADDSILDGTVPYTIVLGASTSADLDFSGINPADVSVSNLDNDVPPTKFYVVDDGSANRTYEYGTMGSSIENYTLNSGNAAPRGAASTAAGDKVWVVDVNRNVYVYNNSGVFLGSWTAGALPSNATVEGIATNGTDVWIVDARTDRVYQYTGAASRTSDSQIAASSFALNSNNTSPKDVVTDGAHLWVVNDANTNRVFKYTVAGQLVGSWTINGANTTPTGITIDPANVSDIWIVDSGTDRVYYYPGAASQTSGSRAAESSFALAAGNTNPQGIADPPAYSLANSTGRSIAISHILASSELRRLNDTHADFELRKRAVSKRNKIDADGCSPRVVAAFSVRAELDQAINELFGSREQNCATEYRDSDERLGKVDGVLDSHDFGIAPNASPHLAAFAWLSC